MGWFSLTAEALKQLNLQTSFLNTNILKKKRKKENSAHYSFKAFLTNIKYQLYRLHPIIFSVAPQRMETPTSC